MRDLRTQWQLWEAPQQAAGPMMLPAPLSHTYTQQAAQGPYDSDVHVAAEGGHPAAGSPGSGSGHAAPEPLNVALLLVGQLHGRELQRLLARQAEEECEGLYVRILFPVSTRSE